MRVLGKALGRLRARLATRPDSEHEQALVRLIVGVVLVVYLLPDALKSRPEPTLVMLAAYLGVSIVIFVNIIMFPGVSHPRRVLAAMADVGTLTWCMVFLGERAAPMVLIYIWILP